MSKTSTLTKRLSLHTETLRILTDGELVTVAGGEGGQTPSVDLCPSVPRSCPGTILTNCNAGR